MIITIYCGNIIVGSTPISYSDIDNRGRYVRKRPANDRLERALDNPITGFTSASDDRFYVKRRVSTHQLSNTIL
ncbi:hypothetical protein HSR122_2678 [Halapricum desulfuricans]|uniref:Uncharacterized protein n=1 Tax=Halapricum desulfuricans TaxID=2841257 RepID=A0A897NBM1_9EURY|nr:hypothetical protein HSR122_2678 [Halapricum desulfuricans]